MTQLRSSLDMLYNIKKKTKNYSNTNLECGLRQTVQMSVFDLCETNYFLSNVSGKSTQEKWVNPGVSRVQILTDVSRLEPHRA